MNYIKYNLKEWENVLSLGSERDDITFRICKDTSDGDVEDALELISKKYKGLKRTRGPFVKAVKIVGEEIDSFPISNVELALYWTVSQSEIVSKYGNKLTGREKAIIKCELNSGNIIWVEVSTISRDKRIQELMTGDNKLYKNLDQAQFSEIFLKDICKMEFEEIISLNTGIEDRYNGRTVDLEYITKNISRELFKSTKNEMILSKPLVMMHKDIQHSYMWTGNKHTPEVILREFTKLLWAQRTLKNSKLLGNLFISSSRGELIPLITNMPVSINPYNLKGNINKSGVKDVILECVSNYNKCIGENGEGIKYNSITAEVISDLLYEVMSNGSEIISEEDLEDGFLSQNTGIGKSIVELINNIIDTFESDSYKVDKYEYNKMDIKHEWVSDNVPDKNHSGHVNDGTVKLKLEVGLTKSSGKVETVHLSTICIK